LGEARRAYAVEIKRALQRAGFEDVPRSGAGVIGGIARNGAATQGRLARGTRVSKQAASQLVDTLVARGYVERAADPKDRRRVIVDLTDRGRLAAEAIRAAVEEVDAELLERLGAGGVESMRAGLGALVAVRADRAAEAALSPEA
jgi:DNA-binding MarR family transcriptional regulator